MGFWKQRQIEQGELGFSTPPGYYVCDRHVDDYALDALIRQEASESQCSFCDRLASEPIAADADLVVEHIARCVRRNWDRPENVLLHDAESESGYAGTVLDFGEVLAEAGEWPFVNDAFEDFVLAAFAESTWTWADPAALGENEALRFSWTAFKEMVKHRVRFLFVLLDEADDEDEPGWPIRSAGAMLQELGGLISRYGLVADLDEGAVLQRIRLHRGDEHPVMAKELGTPPAVFAAQSRMSPAGIPMFYGATDIETGHAETVTPETEAATAAPFATTRPGRIVDLDRLPQVPSFFDDSVEANNDRPSLGFLAGFKRDVSAAIERDDRIHTEYVPTQVVCEYIRHMFRDPDGRPVDGLAWESARHAGGRNVVLFVENAWCLDPNESQPHDLFNEGRLALRLAGEPQPLQLRAATG